MLFILLICVLRFTCVKNGRICENGEKMAKNGGRGWGYRAEVPPQQPRAGEDEAP